MRFTRRRTELIATSYRGISLVAHAGKVLLNVVASHLSTCCEAEGIVPEATARLPSRTINGRHAVRRAPAARARTTHGGSPVNALDRSTQSARLLSTGKNLLWEVLTRFGDSTRMLTIIRDFHEGMRARVRTDDVERSKWFDVRQGLRQGCAPSPFLINVAFAVHIVLVTLQRGPSPRRGFGLPSKMLE